MTHQLLFYTPSLFHKSHSLSRILTIVLLMLVNEIFYSIQGEGSWMGLPNIFIRLTGCNLRCLFCDTTYAYDQGFEMSIDEIIKEVERYPYRFICITGGEPLIQQETLELIDNLVAKGYTICIETNGSISVKPLVSKQRVMISLDVKCPSSNMHKNMNLYNISLMRSSDQLKFVIKDRVDYDYAKKIINAYRPSCNIFFQPVYRILDPQVLSGWILSDGLPVRISLQIHKMIFGERKGV
ncbi:MAG: radical SAM protein [Candidatus Thermoplasmatota archaeon]